MHISPEIERVVVENLGIIAQEQPVRPIPPRPGPCTDYPHVHDTRTKKKKSLLKSHLTRFFVRASDAPATKIAKLRIMLALVDPANVGVVLGECKVRQLGAWSDMMLSRVCGGLGGDRIMCMTKMGGLGVRRRMRLVDVRVLCRTRVGSALLRF
jgi:hypothetical protein